MKLRTVAKTLFFIAVAAFTSTSLIAAELPEQWFKDFDKAKQHAKESDKPILAVFSAAWCGPCKYMVKSVYPQPEVKEYLKDWVPVYVDEANAPQVTRQFNIRVFPTFVILNSKAEEIGRFAGGAEDGKGFVKQVEAAAKFQERMTTVESKLAENPEDMEALMERARLLSSVDQAKAVSAYEEAYKVNPEKYAELAEGDSLALMVKSKANFEQQIEKADAAVKEDSNNPQVYLDRANAYLGESFSRTLNYSPGHLQKAYEDIKKARQLDPESKTSAEEDFAFFTGWLAEDDQAVTQLKKFVENYPDSVRVPFAQYRLYVAAIEAGKTDQAFQHIQAAAEAVPSGHFADWLIARSAEMAVEAAAEELNIDAPDLKVAEFVKGDPVEIDNGNIYVIEFWATWCPPCRASIPHLTELQHKYNDSVTVIGISGEAVDKVASFVKEKDDEMNYTVAVDDNRAMSKAYMEKFGVRGIPHAFVIDREGKIVWHGHPLEDLDQVVGQVVAGTFDQRGYLMSKKVEETRRDKLMSAYRGYFKNVEDPQRAGEQARYVLENADGDANLLNAMAWGILTEVPEKHRDIKLAMKAARQALDLDATPQIYDTYALACFQAGQVEDAIANQSKAVELTEVAQDKAQLQVTLDKYLEAKAKQSASSEK